MPVDRAKRAIAYHAIDTERAYQETRWPAPQSVEGFMNDVQIYARRLLQTAGPDSLKLSIMRKIAALCVACFEQHGVPLRDGFPGSYEEIMPVLRARVTARKVEGYATVNLTGAEYEMLYERNCLDFIAGEDGAKNVPVFLGLVVDRLDAIR